MGYSSYELSDTGASIPIETHRFANEGENEYKLIFPDNKEILSIHNYKGNNVFQGREMWDILAQINGKDDGVMGYEELGQIAYDEDISPYSEDTNRITYVFPKIISKNSKADYFDLPDSRICPFQGSMYPETIGTRKELDDINKMKKLDKNAEARDYLFSMKEQGRITPELLNELRFDLSPKEMIEIAGEEATKKVPFIDNSKPENSIKNFTIFPIWKTDSEELVKVSISAKSEDEARFLAVKVVNSEEYRDGAKIEVVGVKSGLKSEPEPYSSEVEKLFTLDNTLVKNPLNDGISPNTDNQSAKMKSFDIDVPIQRSCFATAEVSIYAKTQEEAIAKVKNVSEDIFMECSERNEMMVSDYEEITIGELDSLKVKENKPNKKNKSKIGMG